MTTVATDGKSMACDGLSTLHNTIVNRDRDKIVRLKDGSLFAAAGDSAEGMAIAAWLDEGGARCDYPKVDDVDAMVLRPDGTVVVYDKWSQGFADPVETPIALGSGAVYAMAAMDAGSSPEKAVEIAALRDTHTGGTIRVKQLKE